jgi:taurine dioxygenase
MDVEVLTPAIGAIVHGVDLRAPLADADRDGIHAALMEHLVLFFRDQPLTGEQQVAFAANFGDPVPGSAASAPDDPDRWFVTLEDGPDAEPKSDRWHTDVPFTATPPDIAVLTMPAPAPVGGDTMWLSLNAVWEGLSPVLQRLLEPLQLEFDMGPSKEAARELYGDEFYRQLLANEPVATHPLVRIHPITGRPAVFLGGAFMRGIAGMHVEESDALLGFLQSRLHDPNLQVRWRWRQHDVAMWDERCTNHRGLSDHYPQHRLVRRVVVGQGVPQGISLEGATTAS